MDGWPHKLWSTQTTGCWKGKWKLLTGVRLFETPWNSPGQNTGVGGLSLLQGDLLDPGIEPRSPALQADSLLSEIPGKPLLFLFYIMTTWFNMKTWQSEGTKILVFSVCLIRPHPCPRTSPVPLDRLLPSRWPGSLLCFKNFGRILVPWPGIEPRPTVVKVPSSNHVTTREFPTFTILRALLILFTPLTTGNLQLNTS